MMILGLLKNHVPNDGAWKGAVMVSAVMSLFDGLHVAQASGMIPFDLSGVMDLIYLIPFAKQGFAWVVPSMLGFVLGAAAYKIMGKESVPYEI